MKRDTRPIVLTCEDFAAIGWDTNDRPWNASPDHCCAGCHYEADMGMPAGYIFTRIFPRAHRTPSRVELRVCCTLRDWLEAQGHLGETCLPPAGSVLFDGEAHTVGNVRAYLDTRTVNRDFVARLVRAARRKAKEGACPP
jgi:hypothetical protein